MRTSASSTFPFPAHRLSRGLHHVQQISSPGDVLLIGGSQWLPALFYLILNIVGGVLAVLLGDWLGQLCISKVRRSVPSSKGTRRMSGMQSGSPFQRTTPHQHLDRQDDLLFPDMQDERETRQKHSGR